MLQDNKKKKNKHKIKLNYTFKNTLPSIEIFSNQILSCSLA